MRIDKIVHKGNFKGQYIYRSVKFEKSDRVSNGYYGAYSVAGHDFSYRSDVLDYIDNRVDK